VFFDHLNQFLSKKKAVDLMSSNFELWSNTLAHLTPTVRRNRMRIVRNFCIYRSRNEPGCFVPDKHTFPAPHQPIRPHIFTEAQIVRLLRAADLLRPLCRSPLRPHLFRLAIVLLYTAGLRRGELARLTLSDYNKKERTLHVRESKFHKSRYVPLSADASREIEKYLEKRRRLRLPMCPESSLLWNTFCSDGIYSGEGLGNSLRRLMIAADIRKEDGNCSTRTRSSVYFCSTHAPSLVPIWCRCPKTSYQCWLLTWTCLDHLNGILSAICT